MARPIIRPAAMLVDRQGPLVRIRAADGKWNIATQTLAVFDSMMTHVADPRNAPETLVLRESIRAWRFYDLFRIREGSHRRKPIPLEIRKICGKFEKSAGK
jgi:predicted ATPase